MVVVLQDGLARTDTSWILAVMGKCESFFAELMERVNSPPSLTELGEPKRPFLTHIDLNEGKRLAQAHRGRPARCYGNVYNRRVHEMSGRLLEQVNRSAAE